MGCCWFKFRYRK